MRGEAHPQPAPSAAESQPTNMQFALLSALGIFFVVDGHLNNSFFDIGGLLPYYSFHMQLFVFISGYFCREDGRGLVSYGIKKCRRLMLPYFAWNLIYGLLAALLRSRGFAFGEPVTLWTLFIEPFCTGYQFILNHAAWFVPALFLVELAHRGLAELAHWAQARQAQTELAHRAQAWRARQAQGEPAHRIGRRTAGEWPLLFVSLLLGLGAIWTAKHVGTEGFLLTLVRMLFLLPFYCAGNLYRRELEARDRLGSPAYFSLILLAALVLALRGRPVIYAVSHCRDFPGYLTSYLSAFLGIAFWLRVSRILAPAIENSALVRYAGRNTYPIMMHHMMVFLGIKTVYAFLAKYAGIFTGFDFEAYKTDFYYCYYPRGLVQLRVFYLAAGLVLPLALHWIMTRVMCTLREKMF